jgi:hypothetical protein
VLRRSASRFGFHELDAAGFEQLIDVVDHLIQILPGGSGDFERARNAFVEDRQSVDPNPVPYGKSRHLP